MSQKSFNYEDDFPTRRVLERGIYTTNKISLAEEMECIAHILAESYFLSAACGSEHSCYLPNISSGAIAVLVNKGYSIERFTNGNGEIITKVKL